MTELSLNQFISMLPDDQLELSKNKMPPLKNYQRKMAGHGLELQRNAERLHKPKKKSPLECKETAFKKRFLMTIRRTKEDYASALLELETWRRQSDQSANEIEQKDRQITAIQREVRKVVLCLIMKSAKAFIQLYAFSSQFSAHSTFIYVHLLIFPFID